MPLRAYRTKAQNERRQVFVLRLGLGQSIGPLALRSIWATACDSPDVGVSRRTQNDAGYAIRPSYGLWARYDFNRIPVEQRLRSILDADGYFFTLISMGAQAVGR